MHFTRVLLGVALLVFTTSAQAAETAREPRDFFLAFEQAMKPVLREEIRTLGGEWRLADQWRAEAGIASPYTLLSIDASNVFPGESRPGRYTGAFFKAQETALDSGEAPRPAARGPIQLRFRQAFQLRVSGSGEWLCRSGRWDDSFALVCERGEFLDSARPLLYGIEVFVRP